MASLKRMYFGQPGTATTGTLLYTAPLKGAVVRNIHICNTTVNAVNVWLGINGTPNTAANALYSSFTIPPNGIHAWSGSIVLGGSDTLLAYQQTSGALTMTISGVEE